MCTQEFSTALNRWCKHNGQSARRCRCRHQMPVKVHTQ